MTLEDIREYCLTLPYTTEDMPFGDDYITFRVGNKIFCGLALTHGSVVQLKWSPQEFDEVLAEHAFVSQAWHWHKRHMIQFDLDADQILSAVAKELIDRAYQYVWQKLPRRVKTELTSK